MRDTGARREALINLAREPNLTQRRAARRGGVVSSSRETGASDGGGGGRRWRGHPGEERRDGYRGSSAIIGAESLFFSTTDIDLGEAVRIRGTSIPCDSQRRPAARCITAHRASRGTSAGE